MILIYSIDGNIGSGKSTIVESLKDKFKENYLKSKKDLEDARHLRIVYEELINEEEIINIKRMIMESRL